MADTTNDTNSDNPGDLRNQRDQLATTNKELAAKLAAYEQDEQLREAGFGHLSKRQRRTILRDLAEDGKDLSADSVTELAKEHGYPLAPASTPTSDNGNGDGQSTGDPNPNANQNQNQEPNDAEDALTAMDLMDRARKAASGNSPTSDFETEIKKTNNAAELTELIRTKGARNQIVHEWDVP